MCNLKKAIHLNYSFLASLIFIIAFPIKVSAVKFYNVNTEFGISFRVTNSICKDDQGFIWASSKTGIIRLTENNYRIYSLPYETAGAVVVTLNYTNSKLIAYTNNGQIFSYDPVHDRFELVINLRKIIPGDLFNTYTLLIDNKGDFWIALNTGLYKYHLGKLSFIQEVSKERYSITSFSDHQLIIAKTDGLWLLDINSLENRCIFENKSVKPFIVSAFYHDRIQNRLWIGTNSNGLYSFDFNTAALSEILPSSFPKQPILAIEENSDSTVLIGVDGQGVWELNRKGTKVLNVLKENEDDPYSLRGNGVYDIYCEKGKRVWICTITGGVSYYDLSSPSVNQIVHRANDANSLVNNDVNYILEDRNGKIWFATNNGISRWDVKTNKWKSFYFDEITHSQVFLCLAEDNEGRIWAGTYSSGIYILDAESGRELEHFAGNKNKSPSVSDFVFDIFKDSQGDLWIGGVDGKLPCYLSKEKKFKTYSDEPISVFAELYPGQILLGASNGIKLLDKETGEIEKLLPGYEIQDILVSGDVIWVCTSGQGLLEYNYKNKTIRKYTSEEGLPSDFVNSVVSDNMSLWLGTESGLCRFDLVDKTVTTFSSLVPL
jgi:ligand-binding sensor domain-containing protein